MLVLKYLHHIPKLWSSLEIKGLSYIMYFYEGMYIPIYTYVHMYADLLLFTKRRPCGILFF